MFGRRKKAKPKAKVVDKYNLLDTLKKVEVVGTGGKITTFSNVEAILAEEKARVIDATVRAARERGYCGETTIILQAVYGDPRDTRYFDSDGRDCWNFDTENRNKQGFDRDGYDRNGFNRRSFNREGFDRNGFNRQGYNHNNVDRMGNPRPSGSRPPASDRCDNPSCTLCNSVSY